MSQQTRAYVCNYDDGCGWASVEADAPMEATEFITCPACESTLQDGRVVAENPSELDEGEIKEIFE